MAIEMFQNIMKHAYNSPYIFLFNEHSILSGNLIDNQNIPALHNTLSHLNTINKEELTTLYKETLTTTSFSHKGGAGLGLIQIARKSQQLQWTFVPINNQSSIFLLKVSF